MSSEVNLPLTNPLTDLSPRRATEGRVSGSDRDSATNEGAAAFGSLVESQTRSSKAPEVPLRRRDPRAQRLMPGQLAKTDKPAPQAETPPAAPKKAEAADKPKREAKDATSDREAPREAAKDATEHKEEITPAGTKVEESAGAKPETAKAEGETEAEGADAVTAGSEGDAAATPAEAAIVVDAAPEAPVVPVVATEAAPATLASTAADSAEIAIDADGAKAPTNAALAQQAATTETKAVAQAAGDAGKTDATTSATSADAFADAAKAGTAEADAEAKAQEAGTAKTGAGQPKEAAQLQGREGESRTKSTQPNLHPTRAIAFAELVDSFHAGNIHRPADILAGLDRTAAGNARAEQVSRPTPLQMLPIEIGMQAVRGATNFQIRLDPAELGRIDVQLQIKENGEVNANLVVDRVETLAMLRRDASTLQQAFEQAGLRQSQDGLSFSLRGEGQNSEGREGRNSGANRQDSIDEAAFGAAPVEAAMRRVMIPNASIDRMI